MRFKGPEKSSILLLGRNTVMIGAVVIIVVSFVFGYFFGYKGIGNQEKTKRTEEVTESKPAPTPPAEEKKPIESIADNAPVLPPSIKPPEFPKESESRKPAIAPKESGKPEKIPPVGQKATEVPKIDTAPNQLALKDEDKPNLEDIGSGEAMKKEGVKGGAKSGKASPKGKKSAKVPKTAKAEKKAEDAEPAKGLYSVQLGAFPSREGAEQLMENLKSKKIKAYIVNAGEGNSYFRVRTGSFKDRKDADKLSATLQKKDGIQNFVTAK